MAVQTHIKRTFCGSISDGEWKIELEDRSKKRQFEMDESEEENVKKMALSGDDIWEQRFQS